MTRCAICLLAVIGGLLAFAPASAQDGELAITNVNVIDAAGGRVLPNQTVLIAGNRIRQVDAASNVRVPAGARVIDGTGKYVIPGLFDMHAHLIASGRPAEFEMPLLIANGVTGVRDMFADCRRPAPGLFGCIEGFREWQKQIEAGSLIGPRIVQLASWLVTGPSGVTDSMPSFFKATTREDGRQLARYFKERGVDVIKVYPALPREGYLGLAEEANRLGLPFVGHELDAFSAIEISNAGQRSVEHARVFLRNCFGAADSVRNRTLRLPGTDLRRRAVDDYDAQRCAEIFSTFARNRTWYVPTHLTRKMDAFAHDSAYRSDPRLKYLPAVQRQRWHADANGMVSGDPSPRGRQAYMDYYRKGLEITGEAYRAGVPIMLGTDAGDSFVFPGFSVHDELEELIAAGLSPAQALVTATLHPAEYLGRTQDFGAVAKGRFADLVLLEANPLDDIRNTRRIAGVVANGRYHDRAALDRLLASVEAAAAK